MRVQATVAPDAVESALPPEETAARPEVSIVAPFYNEEENVDRFCQAVREALASWTRSYELILVDDGSSDGTLRLLRRHLGRDPHVRVLALRANVGQTRAMLAGFTRAAGKIIVSIDGDLQNDPSDIPALVEKLEEGYDVVCGWRKRRRDSFLVRTLPSRIANGAIAKLTGVGIHDTGCSLKAYRSELLQSLRLYSDMHRFLPALSSIAGARITELPVRHHPRTHGQSKYGIRRTVETFADILTLKMLTHFASRPGLLIARMSLPWFATAAVIGVAWAALRYAGAMRGNADLSFALCAAGLLALFAGALTLCLSVLAEIYLAHSDRSYTRRLVEVLTISRNVGAARPSEDEDSPPPELSVVCVAGDRAGDVGAIHEELCQVLASAGIDAEFLYVVDGSRPRAELSLAKIRADRYPVRLFRMAKGFGEATGLDYAFRRAKGRYVVTLPSRLQADLSAVPEIVERLRAGEDVVVTRREPRRDPLPNRIQGRVFHWLMGGLSGVKRFQDLTCGVRGFTAEAARSLDLYGDLHLFIPLLATRLGHRVLEVPVAQRQEDCVLRLFRPRVYMRRLLDILNALLLTRFTRKPQRLFGTVALTVGGLGLALAVAPPLLQGHWAWAGYEPYHLLCLLLLTLATIMAAIGQIAEVMVFYSARGERPLAIEMTATSERRESHRRQIPVRPA